MRVESMYLTFSYRKAIRLETSLGLDGFIATIFMRKCSENNSLPNFCQYLFAS